MLDLVAKTALVVKIFWGVTSAVVKQVMQAETARKVNIFKISETLFGMSSQILQTHCSVLLIRNEFVEVFLNKYVLFFILFF